MKSINPIETRYNGYRFRSRLEARWAVFFDNMSIKYEYELEGFTLPSGSAYLPDFYLPDLGLYVEIKPSEKINYNEMKKLIEFSLQGNNPLLLIVGTPMQESMFLIDRRHDPLIDEIESDDEEEIVSIVFETLRDYNYVRFGVAPFSPPNWMILYRELPPNADFELNQALLKGRQARFEYGESG